MDHDVEILDVPRQEGEQRNVSPKKASETSGQTESPESLLATIISSSQHHLQTPFTGYSSDTDLGKTQRSESTVEPGTSGVGESHRQMYGNHVEKFDAKVTESQDLQTTKECGQSSVCCLCEKRMETEIHKNIARTVNELFFTVYKLYTGSIVSCSQLLIACFVISKSPNTFWRIYIYIPHF